MWKNMTESVPDTQQLSIHMKFLTFVYSSKNVRAVTVMHYYSLPIYPWFWSLDTGIAASKINDNIVPYGYMKYLRAPVTSHNCAYTTLISAFENKQLF